MKFFNIKEEISNLEYKIDKMECEFQRFMKEFKMIGSNNTTKETRKLKTLRVIANNNNYYVKCWKDVSIKDLIRKNDSGDFIVFKTVTDREILLPKSKIELIEEMECNG